MAIKYTTIFHRKTLQNLPKFGSKTNHLAAQRQKLSLKPVDPQTVAAARKVAALKRKIRGAKTDRTQWPALLRVARFVLL
jgi:hypothetical protein